MPNPELSKRLIFQIAGGIRSGRVKGLGISERDYLLEIAERLDNGSDDPLGIKQRRGRPSNTARDYAIAKEVAELHLDQGVQLEAALDRVGEKYHLSGPGNGVVERVFYRLKKDLKAARIIYQSRKEGRRLSEEERDEIEMLLESMFSDKGSSGKK